MPRIARVILPGYPHHITQRGNRKQDVFFYDSDYRYYLKELKDWCDAEDIEIWAYCLMTNHVHLIVKPEAHSNLSKAIGETHRRYTRMINFREGWKGYLWQGRFASYPMDEDWLLRAMAYVELNPVKAGMVQYAWEYPWSSVHAHLSGEDHNGLVNTDAVRDYIGGWKAYLMGYTHEFRDDFKKHESTGRPMGSEQFVETAERMLGRKIKKEKPGPRKRGDN